MEINEIAAIKLVLVGTVLLVVDISVRTGRLIWRSNVTMGWIKGESWFDSKLEQGRFLFSERLDILRSRSEAAEA
jgi:hypothetical protein